MTASLFIYPSAKQKQITPAGGGRSFGWLRLCSALIGLDLQIMKLHYYDHVSENRCNRLKDMQSQFPWMERSCSKRLPRLAARNWIYTFRKRNRLELERAATERRTAISEWIENQSCYISTFPHFLPLLLSFLSFPPAPFYLLDFSFPSPGRKRRRSLVALIFILESPLWKGAESAITVLKFWQWLQWRHEKILPNFSFVRWRVSHRISAVPWINLHW